MIVQPDFLRHFKTRKLVTLTGDPASPLMLIRLWAHCQASRQCEFPNLSKTDLESICEWSSPKITCEKALIACRWIEKIPGGGYLIRNWNEHNKNLIANWNRNPSGLKRDDGEATPPATPRATPPNTQLDQTKSDGLTKSDQPDAPRLKAPPVSEPQRDGFNSVSGSGGMDGGLVEGLAARFTANSRPDLKAVQEYLKVCFAGAEKFAAPFHKAMTKSSWRDKDGKAITDWKALAKAYASKAAMNQGAGASPVKSQFGRCI